MMEGSNYPPGVTDAHPYFNPPTPPLCSECKEEMEWDDDREEWRCDEHGDEEQPTAEDIAYRKAEMSSEWEGRGGL